MGWFKRAARGTGKFLWSGAGAGIGTAALGLATGNPAALTMGMQLAAGGLVKKASKRAGREIHRIGSPLASLGVLAAANAMGMDAPVELTALAVSGADPTAAQAAVQFILNGVLPGGLQTFTKNTVRAEEDFRKRRAY